MGTNANFLPYGYGVNLGSPLAPYMMMNINAMNGTTNPNSAFAAGGGQAFGDGFTIGAKNQLQSKINQLNSYDASIGNMLSSPNLTGAQITDLNALRDQIRDLKRQAEEQLRQNSIEQLSYHALLNNITALENNMSQRVRDINEALARTNNTSAGGGTSAGGTGSVTTPNTEPDDNEEREIDPISPERRQHEETVDNMRATCSTIVDALYCWWGGTDEEKLDAAFATLNKDNILALIEKWDESYTNIENESVFLAIANDVDGAEEWQKYCGGILDLLKAKARDLNIDVSAEAQAVGNAISSKNEAAYNTACRTLYNKIKAANEEKLTQADQRHVQRQERENAQRAERRAAAEQRRTEEGQRDQRARDQFLADLREITGNQNAEVSDSVTYENGRFKIRIMGRDYTGRDYLALAEALRRDNLAPERYLKKA